MVYYEETPYLRLQENKQYKFHTNSHPMVVGDNINIMKMTFLLCFY